MAFIRARRWACVYLLTWWCGTVLADRPPEPSGSLTLTAAVQAALQRNPELTATDYVLKTSAARITQAGLRQNPQLSLELEDFAGTGDASGVRSLQTTLSLSQVIELGEKRQRRIAAAQADRDLNGIERQAQQLDVLAEVSRRFIRVVEAQETLALAQRTVELSDSSLRAIDARVQAARSPEAERSRARVALLRAQLEQQHAASELGGARHMLAALWGSTTPAFTRAEAQLFELPQTADLADLMRRLQANPDFLRFASEARLREAELRLAQAQARANLNLSLGVRWLEASDDVGLVAGFSVPLRLFDRNQGAIRAAESARDRTAAMQRAAQIKAEATLGALYQEFTAGRTRADTLRNEGLPQAQLALEQTRYGYERGRFSYLELAAAQRELVELETAAVAAAAETHRLLIEIERLTEEPLTTESD